MIKIYKLISIIVLFAFSANGSIINIEISNKYEDIFSKNILSNYDKLNYQNAFISQETCEWKRANKYILRIKK